MPFHVMLVAGARPNFIKVAPVLRALSARGSLRVTLVHTGQHYDDAMSGAFFRLLGMPEPDVNLNVGSASHAVQTARIMERFEPVVLERRPDCVVVFGDVNSTAACALVAAKLLVPAVHVEAGLRSFDRTMPEEINRIVTDALCDLLLASEPAARPNLLAEGRPAGSIVEIGNVMIDSLEHMRPRMEALAPWEQYGFARGRYGLVTLHRPSNVDDPGVLRRVLDCLERCAAEIPLVFPVHPRTKAEGWRVEAPARQRVEVGGPSRLPREPGASGRSGRCLHRLRRHPGGELASGGAVPDASAQHRAPRHRRFGHFDACRQRSRAHRSRLSRRPVGRLQEGPTHPALGRPGRRPRRRGH